MTKFYLVRHGEADYTEMLEKGFWGFGRSFAPLSEEGVKQAQNTSKDERLKSAQLIVSSPYTRALQTAAIISRETGLNIEVEVDLHEWEPDKTSSYKTSQEAFRYYREFNRFKGEYPDNQQMKWETLSELRSRVRSVLDKYSNYEKVIIVGHSMVFRTVKYLGKIEYAKINELDYIKGQNDCEFYFIE